MWLPPTALCASCPKLLLITRAGVHVFVVLVQVRELAAAEGGSTAAAAAADGPAGDDAEHYGGGAAGGGAGVAALLSSAAASSVVMGEGGLQMHNAYDRLAAAGEAMQTHRCSSSSCLNASSGVLLMYGSVSFALCFKHHTVLHVLLILPLVFAVLATAVLPPLLLLLLLPLSLSPLCQVLRLLVGCVVRILSLVPWRAALAAASAPAARLRGKPLVQPRLLTFMSC
jgi:hypothetical protein